VFGKTGLQGRRLVEHFDDLEFLPVVEPAERDA
jgi:hypothetical protein